MDEIIPNLWLGNIYEAINKWHKFDTIITVLHLDELTKFEMDDYKIIKYTNLINIPILRQTWKWSEPLKDYVCGKTWVDPLAMDSVYGVIKATRRQDNRILVCCGAGQERAPLAVTWYLFKLGLDYYSTKPIKEYFEFVKAKHPQTLDRLSWLSKCDTRIFSEEEVK